MSFDLASVSSEIRQRAPRIIVLGVEKIGKSTFAAGANAPIFLPIKGEEGVDDIKVPKAPVCNSFGDVMGWIGSLYTEDHPHQSPDQGITTGTLEDLLVLVRGQALDHILHHILYAFLRALDDALLDHPTRERSKSAPGPREARDPRE